MPHRKHLNAIKEAENQSIRIQQKVVTVKKEKKMKKTTWDTILKVVIAVASAILGALSAHAMVVG